MTSVRHSRLLQFTGLLLSALVWLANNANPPTGKTAALLMVPVQRLPAMASKMSMALMVTSPFLGSLALLCPTPSIHFPLP